MTRDLSAMVGELAALKGDDAHWLGAQVALGLGNGYLAQFFNSLHENTKQLLVYVR